MINKDAFLAHQRVLVVTPHADDDNAVRRQLSPTDPGRTSDRDHLSGHGRNVVQALSAPGSAERADLTVFGTDLQST